MYTGVKIVVNSANSPCSTGQILYRSHFVS
jgi:hypothetical protein